LRPSTALPRLDRIPNNVKVFSIFCLNIFHCENGASL
jgi:hypothetical protein